MLGGSAVGTTTSITNVENLNFSVLSGTGTVDGTNIKGYKKISTKDSAGTLTMANVNGKADYEINNSTGGLNLTFTASTVAAGNDALDVNLNNVSNGGTLTIASGIETLNLHTSNGAAKMNAITDTAGTIATVVVDGGQDFTLTTAMNAAATTVDAREAGASKFQVASVTSAVLTGSKDDTITKTVADNAGDFFNLGAGNDTLVFNGVAATGVAATYRGVENFVMKNAADVLDLTNADQAGAITFEGGGALAANNLTSGSTVKVDKVAATTLAVGFQGTVMGEATTIDAAKGITTSLTVTNVSDLTVNYGTTSNTAMALDETAANTEVTKKLAVNMNAGTITAGNLTQADKLTDLVVTSAAGVTTAGIGTFVDAESLTNLTVNAGSATAIGAIGGTTASTKLDKVEVNATGGNVTLGQIDAANVSGISSITLNATGGTISSGNDIINTGGSIKQVTLSGSKDIDVDLIVTAGNVEKVNSTATGNVTLDITNAGAAGSTGTVVVLGNAATGKTNTVTIDGTSVKNSVTGGTGSDVITTDDGADTIVGGAGNDTITAGGAADTMTGGAGADTFVFAVAGTTGTFGATATTAVTGAAAVANGFDVIIDYSGTSKGDKDIIDAGAAIVLTTAATHAGVTVNAAGLVTNWNTASTLAEKLVEAEAALQADVATTANQAIAFVDGGKTYVLISDANAGLTQGDVVIELTGLAATTGITIASGDITNIA